MRAAIASGACTLDDVAAVCDAGSRCGGCRPELARLLAESGAPERDRVVV